MCFVQDPFAVKEVYSDNALDKFMIWYFAKKMSDQLGGKPDRLYQHRRAYGLWHCCQMSGSASYSMLTKVCCGNRQGVEGGL